jgi:signal transduction histidine kinase
VKLARKILLPVLLLLIGVIGVFAYLAVREETALYEEDLHEDQISVARAVAAAVEASGDDAPRIRQMVQAASRAESPSMHELKVELATLPAGVDPYVTHLTGSRYETYAPIGQDGRAVRVSESRNELDRTVAHTWHRWLITGSVLAATSAGLVLLLGSLLLARPISRLVGLARRVGAGDLSPDRAWQNDDELGELGREMSHMCELLADARHRAADEVDKRLAAVHALRHADRLGTVGQLAAGVAHELGTPLNVVQGRAQLMLEDPQEPASVTKSATVIVDQVTKMTGIIRNLLDFARTDPEGEAVDCQPFAVAQKTVDLLRSMAKHEGLVLELDAKNGSRAAHTSVPERLLGQVLANLVVNAIHASEGRAGVIELHVDAKRAAPPAGGAEGDYLAVTVTDHGAGIAPEHIDHIFEPFFTTKDVGKGTGLGLSVSYGIVRDAGGWIEVESKPGEGARFTVWLPARAAEAG